MWLYRYVFRGLGLVLVIGMITVLGLAILSQFAQPIIGVEDSPR